MNNKDLQIIELINRHYKELSEEIKSIHNINEFKDNKIIQKAVIFDLLQIGENINKLTNETKGFI